MSSLPSPVARASRTTIPVSPHHTSPVVAVATIAGFVVLSCALPARVEFGAPCASSLECASPYACVDARCLFTCTADAECDDGVYCNGAERCDDNACVGSDAPCTGAVCDEGARVCTACSSDAQCDDGAFCTGVERCIDGA